MRRVGLGLVFGLWLVPAEALGGAPTSEADDDDVAARRHPSARPDELVIRAWDDMGEPAAWALRSQRLLRVRAREPRPVLPEGVEDDGTVDVFELGRSMRAVVADRIDDETGYVDGRVVRIFRRERQIAELGDDNSRFGAHVGVAGDIDGDGRDDLFVTSPSACDCCDCSGFTDDVRLYLATRSPERFRLASTLRGRDGMQGWIYAQPVGDVNRDGHDDVVVAHGEEMRLHRGGERGLAAQGELIHQRRGHSGDLAMQRLPGGRPGLFWIDREDRSAGIAQRHDRRLRVQPLDLP